MGVSFLTPLDALFGLAAAVPLAALLLAERRGAHVRRALALSTPRRRALAPIVLALALLPALVAVAAAQPVVVRQKMLTQRADVQAFFVFDTSLSMDARPDPGAPNRLARAKAEALRLRPMLGDIPVGIATMTDRTLPDILPTTDLALFRSTLAQSVGIDRPPPSQQYKGRATTFDALVPVGDSHFFSPGVKRRILVVFTDGESSHLAASVRLAVRQQFVIPPLLVHVWRPDDRIYVRGKVDPHYIADPTSGAALEEFASLTGGRVFGEDEMGKLAATIRAMAGPPRAEAQVSAYARVALAPWFILGGVVPLAFLLWKRNL